MATSGTSVFNFTRNQIIKTAGRKIGAFEAGETPDDQTVEDFADQLNVMVKAWDATGIHIWTEEEATLFLEPNQAAYVIGGASVDNAVDLYRTTKMAIAANNGAGSITVVSTVGMSSGDHIGILVDDGSIFWTTINGAPAGNVVTLTNPLTDSAALNNPLFSYTNQIVRPLRVVSCRRFNLLSNIETPMNPMLSRLDYRALPNKLTTGVPTQAFYDPRGGAASQGILYVWPVPIVAADFVKFTYYRPMQDFNTAGNNPDLPTEWINALVWNLAYEMAPEYDCPPQRYQMIQQRAAQTLDLASGWDKEAESYLFGFDAGQQAP